MEKPEPRMLTITVTDLRGSTKQVKFKPGTYLIGKGEDCQIRFPANAPNVSRRHAQIVVESGRVTIEDLESDAGTMVNGRIIRQKQLDDEDIVSIAGTSLAISLPKEPSAKESSIILAAPARESVVKDAEQLGAELDKLAVTTRRLAEEVGKRIVGQRAIIRAVWATILARGHCLLVGVPGLAKTFLVNTFAEAMGLQTKRIQFTPDLMPSDIIGSNVIHETAERKRYFEFVQGPVFTQLLLADEINRTPPKTQAALLEAMQERQVTVGDKSLSLPEPFCVIATQNPIEQEGTYPLPEAQQDRFLICLVLDYPPETDEVEILLRTTQGVVPEIRSVMDYHDILRFQGLVDRIAVSRESAAYVARLVRATRPNGGDCPAWVSEVVDWGAGPRAGQSILRAARALAAMDGRPAVSRDDIREIIVPAQRHRISCNYRARAQSLTPDRIVERLVREIGGG